MPIDHINIQNNKRDDELINNNFKLFEDIVLKKGYKQRSFTITEYRYTHRYMHPDMYTPEYSNYETVQETLRGFFGYFQLDHPRYYTTGDNKKVQVCSLYCKDLGLHDMLINDGWIVIKPIYSTQARTYMRFVNVNAMRSQIRADVLRMKLNCFRKRFLRNTTYLQSSTCKKEQKRLRKEVERNQDEIQKTFAQLDNVHRKISLMRSLEVETDISEMLITD